MDLTRRTVQQGYRVAEVPIEFVERTRGASKMNGGIVREALWRVTVWGVVDRFDRLAGPDRAARLRSRAADRGR